MEEKAHENLLASVSGYTGLSKEVQCASKERGEEESSIKKETIFFVFVTCFCKDHSKCPLYFTSRIYFFHLIMMGFCSEGSKELMYLYQLTENPQKGRQRLSNEKPHQTTNSFEVVPLPKVFKALGSGEEDLLVGSSVYLCNTQDIRLDENLTFEMKKEEFGSVGKASES